jgi:hypothetical protein
MHPQWHISLWNEVGNPEKCERRKKGNLAIKMEIE